MDMPDTDALSNELRAMREQQHQDFSVIIQRLSALEATVATEGARCPYWETIARSQNNREQINANTQAIAGLGDDMTGLKVEVAKTAVRLGSMMGAVGSVVTAMVMKALGI